MESADNRKHDKSNILSIDNIISKRDVKPFD